LPIKRAVINTKANPNQYCRLNANVRFVALVTANPISKAAKEQFFISEI
jgi:hypothetical protein